MSIRGKNVDVLAKRKRTQAVVKSTYGKAKGRPPSYSKSHYLGKISPAFIFYDRSLLQVFLKNGKKTAPYSKRTH